MGRMMFEQCQESVHPSLPFQLVQHLVCLCTVCPLLVVSASPSRNIPGVLQVKHRRRMAKEPSNKY